MASLASARGSDGCSWLGVRSPKGFLTLAVPGLLNCLQLACLLSCIPRVVTGPSPVRGMSVSRWAHPSWGSQTG